MSTAARNVAPHIDEPVEPDPVSTGGGSGYASRTVSNLFVFIARCMPAAWPRPCGVVTLLPAVLLAASRSAPRARSSRNRHHRSRKSSSPRRCASGRLRRCRRASRCSARRHCRPPGCSISRDVLGLVPNLNWSGGTSRPRFFQLRGIGELEQYQGAPNPSVGFLIDDIDLSGVGMPATLFDTQQVEVLRGPQGTRYGANALAGLVKIKTRDARDDPGCARGSHAVRTTTPGRRGVAGGGPIGERRLGAGAWRARRSRATGSCATPTSVATTPTAATRRRCAASCGGSWRRAGARISPPCTWILTTASTPSRPTIRARRLRQAGSRCAAHARCVRRTSRAGSATYTVRSVSAYAWSDSVYSFDGDWGNEAYWGEFAPYDYFSRYARERSTLSQDLRVESQPGRRRRLGGRRLCAAARRGFAAARRIRGRAAATAARKRVTAATSLAAYGEAEWPLADDCRSPRECGLKRGPRITAIPTARASTRATRWSAARSRCRGRSAGRASGTPRWHAATRRAASTSGSSCRTNGAQFTPEYLWNASRACASQRRGEGCRAMSRSSTCGAKTSRWRRRSSSIRAIRCHTFSTPTMPPRAATTDSKPRSPGSPSSVCTSARRWGCCIPSTSATAMAIAISMAGSRRMRRGISTRCPRSGAAGKGWMARADLNGVDAFYFDTSHDQRSDPYTLLNLRPVTCAAPGRSRPGCATSSNENYAVRGFYFGLEPPDYADKLYFQRGDGRLAGITLQWRW